MELSSLHKRLLEEGFEPLGMFHNVEFACQSENHYVPPFRKIIELRHVAFRIIPAYLAYDDSPEYYKNRHIVYVSKGTPSKINLLDGCETNPKDF
jgi:hypothetical protein